MLLRLHSESKVRVRVEREALEGSGRLVIGGG